jgi:hypothetical protein
MMGTQPKMTNAELHQRALKTCDAVLADCGGDRDAAHAVLTLARGHVYADRLVEACAGDTATARLLIEQVKRRGR